MHANSTDDGAEPDLEQGGACCRELRHGIQGRDFRSIVKSDAFDMSMTAIIILNMVFVLIETDARADGNPASWIKRTAYAFLAVFVTELAARMFVDRLAFFWSKLNIMDLCIISVDVASQIVNDVWGNQPQMSVLNVFRICRLLRVIRALSAFRELWLMLHGLVSAFKAMFWACVLILVVLFVFSVIGVEVIRPYNEELTDAGAHADCDLCAEAFSSVQQSFVTMFLMVFVGEMWSDVAHPIIKRQPMMGFVFMAAFCIIHLGVLNLILTVIVDGAEQARADTLEEQVMKKKAECNIARDKLLQLCARMDEDGSGELALEELEAGYKANAEFASILHLMDVGIDDLEMVFSILDEDRSGTVTFAEFVDQLHKMKTQESHTLLVFIKHYVNEIREKVTEQLGLVRHDLMTKMGDHEERVSELLALAKDPNVKQRVAMAARSFSNVCRSPARSEAPRIALSGQRQQLPKGRDLQPLGDECVWSPKSTCASSQAGLGFPNMDAADQAQLSMSLMAEDALLGDRVAAGIKRCSSNSQILTQV
jgi:voltage-gated sodium channel